MNKILKAASAYFLLAGIAALIITVKYGNIGTEFLIMEILLVLLFAAAPFSVYLFGLQLGEKVPVDRLSQFKWGVILVAVPLIISFFFTSCYDIPFGLILTLTLFFPVLGPGLLLINALSATNLGLAGVIVILGELYFASMILARYDYKLVWKHEMPEDNADE